MVYLDHLIKRQTPKPETPKRLIKGARRKAVIASAKKILKDWDSSVFEHEADVRHGLRQALVMDGAGWLHADAEAEGIVAECFRNIGAVRPTWEQGQREYTISSENCNWCGIPISDEDRTGSRNRRFCSIVCAKTALVYRGAEAKYASISMGRRAYEILKAAERPQRVCLHCGLNYQPFNRKSDNQKYCSEACKGAARIKHPPRPCRKCKKTFMPHKADKAYCSWKCFEARPVDDSRTCPMCQTGFKTKSGKQVFCSKSCRIRSMRIEKAAAEGRIIHPKGTLFDHVCEECSSLFSSTKQTARFCSNACGLRSQRRRKAKPDNIVTFMDRLFGPEPVAIPTITAEIFDACFIAA